jgi:hypothetical protein
MPSYPVVNIHINLSDRVIYLRSDYYMTFLNNSKPLSYFFLLHQIGKYSIWLYLSIIAVVCLNENNWNKKSIFYVVFLGEFFQGQWNCNTPFIYYHKLVYLSLFAFLSTSVSQII